MGGFTRRLAGAALVVLTAAWAAPAAALECEPAGGFAAWLPAAKQEALARGVSQRTVAAAMDGLTLNRRVIELDRNQTAFRMSFEAFVRQRVTSGRVNGARQRMSRHADLLERIERDFGVPPEVLMAIWAMETDFGGNTGSMSVIRSLAALAYDCRRTEMFQAELFAALRILDRGDLSLNEMRGAWAGELGQTQFLATNYERFAVDYDGNGRADLIRSVPDVLASTANYLRAYGWRAGAPWDEGTHNFAVLREWNRAQVYQRALALFANRLKDGASATAAGGNGGGGQAGLGRAQIQEMQRLLNRRGHDVGPADGIVGPRTRAAIAAEQRRLGLTATAAPTAELLDRLRR